MVEKGVSLLGSLLELLQPILISSTVSDAHEIIMSVQRHKEVTMETTTSVVAKSRGQVWDGRA